MKYFMDKDKDKDKVTYKIGDTVWFEPYGDSACVGKIVDKKNILWLITFYKVVYPLSMLNTVTGFSNTWVRAGKVLAHHDPIKILDKVKVE